MTEPSWAALRALLVSHYEVLRSRLTRRLGSAELAAEALQDTWLRLERPGQPGPLQSPAAYLFRIALNVAADRRHSERRRLAVTEIEALRHLDDDELDPERIAASRSEIAALVVALDELPPRCREIFFAARLEGLPHRNIAQRHGISTRMVEREIRRAVQHCGERLGRNTPSRFGSSPSEASTDEEADHQVAPDRRRADPSE